MALVDAVGWRDEGPRTVATEPRRPRGQHRAAEKAPLRPEARRRIRTILAAVGGHDWPVFGMPRQDIVP